MLVTHYYALALFAGALTAAWLFRPRERTQVTTLGAFLAWSLVALLGDEVQVFDGTIEEIVETADGEQAVATTGELVAAPVPDEVRLLAGLFALASGLALILYILGAYPPETTDPVEVR